eukprot:84748_1
MQCNINTTARIVRYENIGSEIIQHEINYIDKQKEQPIYLKARQCYLNSRWDEAKSEYNKLLSINPNNGSYHNSYACILSRYRGEDIISTLRKARKHSTIATELDPKNISFRFANIVFLMELQENDKAHKQFQIVFHQLFETPDGYDSPDRTLRFSPRIIATSLEHYSTYLFNIGQYTDSAKYLSQACDIRKIRGLDITVRNLQGLALMYLLSEQVEKSLHAISIYEKMNQRTVFEKFHSERTNQYQPWIGLKGEIYLFIEEYDKAYDLLKSELESIKRDNAIYTNMFRYIYLIECCIGLKKFAEVEALDKELFSIYSRNPSLLKHCQNSEISLCREYLIACYLIKKGGENNALKAVMHMEFIFQTMLELNVFGYRISGNAYYYLGLAYKNISHYINKEFYIMKAKKALFQAAHLVPTKTKSLWEFALVLSDWSELYLCRKYANQAWKRCNKIKNIAVVYPKMKKRWKKQYKRIKCGYCGKHEYLKSGKQVDKLKVCKGCYVVYYCNKKCQKLHWKKSHNIKCGKIWMQWNKNLLKTTSNSNPFITFNQLSSDHPLVDAFFKLIQQYKKFNNNPMKLKIGSGEFQ